MQVLLTCLQVVATQGCLFIQSICQAVPTDIPVTVRQHLAYALHNRQLQLLGCA
jgi:hypothetical protein